MSITRSGNTVHDSACNLSEMTRQSAAAAAIGNQATIRTVEIAHYRACLALRLRTTSSRAFSSELL